jgi:hypothetical protein
MKNKPNFFIVGAPKCGTTSLSEYLRTHPNVFMTRPKEPHYFAEDFYRQVSTIEDYLALFDNVSSQHIAIGEASVTYLSSQIAIQNIKEFNSNAKLIAMVRNPVEMIPSLHAQLLVSLEEDEENFERAWFLQAKRKNGENIPSTCRSPTYLQYAEIGHLGAQIKRLFQSFDKHLIKVIVFEDFISTTKKEYQDTLSFLGLPTDGRKDFPRINANKVTRSRNMSLLLRRPPKKFVDSYLGIKNILNLGSIGFFRKTRKMNEQEREREKLNYEMKKELVTTFKEDILLLSDLLDRDLTDWLKL